MIVVPSIREVLALGGAVTFIDIPIGLPDKGNRTVDKAARAMLANAKGAQPGDRSRVFLGMRRALIEPVRDYEATKKVALGLDGVSISRQAHAILPKIAEVDREMRPQRQAAIREAHPELIFLRLNSNHRLARKKSSEGREVRRRLLIGHGFAEIDRWLPRLRGSGAGVDDLFDACACALGAWDAANGLGRRIDCATEPDATGLKMEIWY